MEKIYEKYDDVHVGAMFGFLDESGNLWANEDYFVPLDPEETKDAFIKGRFIFKTSGGNLVRPIALTSSGYMDNEDFYTLATAADYLGLEAEAQATTVFGTAVSDLQEDDVTVSGTAITGTLKYVTEGAIPDYWGAGNFMVLKLDFPEDVSSCKVGMSPSVSSGLMEIKGDPDMNLVAKVTDKNNQKFKVVYVVDGVSVTQLYDLSGLTLEAPLDNNG